MSMSFVCDWCGEQIVCDDEVSGVASVDVSGLYTDAWSCRRPARHFHVGASDDDDSCLIQALSAFDERLATNAPRPRTAKEVKREIEQVWKTTPRERRESLLFQVLGDGRLVIRELTDGLNRELGVPEGERFGTRAVYDGEVRSLVARLLRDGQLEREAETFNKTHMRYRYFARRELEGPIVDLEQAFQDEQDGEVA